MPEKLDAYLPSPETLLAIRRQLLNTGMELRDISDEWIMVVSAAFSKWLRTTADGKQFVTQEIGFDWIQGDPAKEYRMKDGFGAPGRIIKPENVYFLSGVVANGESIPPQMLDIQNRKQDTCEKCHVQCHAAKNVLDPSRQHVMTLCNNCLVNDDSMKVRDCGDSRSCHECTKNNCSHKEDVRKAV